LQYKTYTHRKGKAKMDTQTDEKKEGELQVTAPPEEKKEDEARKTPQVKESSWSEAIGAGAFAGAVGGLAAHYLANGQMTLPIFLVVSIFLLAGLKGWKKFIALVVFVIVAPFVMFIFGL
jgi:hypothetical protein